MTSVTDSDHNEGAAQPALSDRVRNTLVVGWVMKATHQALQDQQQAVATSYLVNYGE